MTDLRRRGLSDEFDDENQEIDYGEESESTLDGDEEDQDGEDRQGSDEEQESDEEDGDGEQAGQEETPPVYKWELEVMFDEIDPDDLEDAMEETYGLYEIEWSNNGAYVQSTHQFAV